MTKHHKVMLGLLTGMHSCRQHPIDLILFIVTDTPATAVELTTHTKIPVADIQRHLREGEEVGWFTCEKKRKGTRNRHYWQRTPKALLLLEEAEGYLMNLLKKALE